MRKEKLKKVLAEKDIKAFKQADVLMDIDNDVWDALGAEDGADIKRNWNKYVRDIGLKLKNKGIYKVDPQTINTLVNDNFHSLVKALNELRVTR